MKKTTSTAPTMINLKYYWGTANKLPYTGKEFKEIMEFYVFHNPAAKNGPKKGDAKRNASWSLKSTPTRSPKELEKELAEVAGLDEFIMNKAETIKETLKNAGLDDSQPICIDHPKAVMRWMATTVLKEDGTAKTTVKETRIHCLFRHVRNSFSHGLIYVFDNGYILLEDRGDARRVTARILIPAKTLKDWMKVMKQ